MATLYWHNLTGDNDATNRENYSTDQAGNTPATPGSMVDDDLLVGAGSQANWVVPAAATLECVSISFEGYTGAQIFPTDAEITAQTVTHLATGGNATGFRGNLYVNQFLNIGRATPIAVSNFDDRLKLNFTGSNPKIQFVGSSSNNVAHNIDPWNILDDDTLEIESLVTGTANEVLVRGGANFAAPGGTIRKTGPGRIMHLSGNGAFSNVSQVLVEGGEYGLGQWPDGTNNSVGKGIGPDPGDVPIILSAGAGLALAAQGSGVNWGINLQVPSGSTGCHLRFSGNDQRIGGGSSNQAQWEVNEDFEVFLDEASNRTAGLAVQPVLAPNLTFTFRYRTPTGNNDPQIQLNWGDPSLSEIVTLLDSPGGNGLATLSCDNSDALVNVQQLTIGAGTYLRSNVTSGNGGVRVGGNVDIHPDASIGMTFNGRAWTFERPNGVYNLLGQFLQNTAAVTNTLTTSNAMQMLFTEDCQLNLRTTSAVNGHRIHVSNGATVELNAGQTRIPVLDIAAGSTLRLMADATANDFHWQYVSGGTLDFNGHTLTVPAFVVETGGGTLDMQGGSTLAATGKILLQSGTVTNINGATFECAEWQSEISLVGTADWFVNASVSAIHLAGDLGSSVATGVPGVIGGTGNDLGTNTDWGPPLPSDAPDSTLLPLGLGMGLGVHTGRNRPWNRPL